MSEPTSTPSGSNKSLVLRMVLVALVVAVGAVALFKFFVPPGPVIAPNAGPVEVARTNLVLESGRLRFAGTTNVFAGHMFEHYASGAQRSRTAVTNGLLHGLSQGWFTNGQLQVEENFREGVSHGTRTKWYSSGVKESEAVIVNGVLQGTYSRWHENGAPSEQVEMVGGRPEGLSLAWFPSRCLRARVLTKDGKVVERTFWKDGEKIPN